MKKILLLSTSILLLSACGNDETPETEETNEVTEEASEGVESNENDTTEETQSGEDSSEGTDEGESDDQENTDQEDTKLTEEEAKERVVNYREEQEKWPNEYEFLMEEEDEVYTASMHVQREGAPIIAMYEVNKTTGEVRELEMGPDEPEPMTSEIVSMSDEERKEHHLEIAAEEQNIEDSLLEHLMLPGLHENTATYEGRVNPDDTVDLSLAIADTPPNYEQLNVSPDVDDEGYFTINLRPYDLSNKSVLRFSINGNYSEEQNFDLPIFEAQEGMESIGVRE